MAMRTNNVKAWRAAMKTWMKAKRGASHDDCINKFGGESCIYATKFTPKAKKTGAMGAGAKPKAPSGSGSGQPRKRRRRNTHVSMFHALATGYRKSAQGWVKHRGVHRGEGNYDEALRIYNSKRRSVGAIAAGFLKPAKHLGVKVKSTPFAGGSASKSKGKKSTRSKMLASAKNEVPASGVYAEAPMIKAMDFVVKREHAWAIKRLQKANNKFSARSF